MYKCIFNCPLVDVNETKKYTRLFQRLKKNICKNSFKMNLIKTKLADDLELRI